MADLLSLAPDITLKYALYHCHDHLLDHKRDLFRHLSRRWKDPFGAKFELLLTAEIAQLHEENRLIHQKLDLVIRQLFRKKSERLDPAQLELVLGELGDADELGKTEASSAHEQLLEVAPDKARRKRKFRERVPEHLPAVETIIEPEAVKACPEAGRCIGEAVSLQLDLEPGRFFLALR